jgi:DNA adenine methylase
VRVAATASAAPALDDHDAVATGTAHPAPGSTVDEPRQVARAFESKHIRKGHAGAQRLPSPLRYPGAKRQLIPLFNRLLLRAPVKTFVEPFAGGASVALHVAANGLADRVVIGEADPLLRAFWHTACFDTAWLVRQVMTVEVSLAAWERFKRDAGSSRRSRALACLFLNRTSFSGILNDRAGPIGGRAQTSDYKIDCRFPRVELARRLRAVGELAASGRIAAVLAGDYQKSVGEARAQFGDEGMLLYLDPPFYNKGQSLYRKSFRDADHRRLADFVLGCQVPWLLSYDYHPAIADLYSTPLVRLPGEPAVRASHRLERMTLTYTAHSRRGSGDELIVTNLPHLPTDDGINR